MKIQKTKQGVTLEVYVKPRSKEFKIVAEGEEVIVFCKEEPVRRKVNKELVKQLSRIFHRNVKLVSGFTSKQKKVLIEDAEETEIEHVLLRK